MEALNLHSLLKLSPNSQYGKVRNTKDDQGSTVLCVEITSRGSSASEACFAKSSGVLVGFNRSGLRCIYSDYVTWRDKTYPRLVRVFDNEVLLAEVRLDDIHELKDTDSELLLPAPSAKRFGWCSDLIAPELIEKSQTPPLYPAGAKLAGVQGTVAVYGVVGTSGKLRDMTVVASPSSELSTAAIEALSKWDFHPAVCNGSPVEAELVTMVHYRLHYPFHPEQQQPQRVFIAR
jgi:TonB family protein